MTARHGGTAGLLAAAATLLGSGCGYTFGSGLQEQGVHTVALRVVGNESYRQRLEADLSFEVSRQLYAGSDLLPATADVADAIIEIVITDDRERTLVPGSRADPVREGSEETAVRMRLLSRRTGKVLLARNLLDRAEYRTPIGEDLTSARKELVRDLARKIALALEAGF
jgi:hypothetical protein